MADGCKEEKILRGIIILSVGIGMILFALLLFITSIIYRKTAGRKIQEELSKEYELVENKGRNLM